MESLAYSPVSIVREGACVLVKSGSLDLGYCSPCKDDKGVQHGWTAFAYQLPHDGFGCASVEEHVSLKTAVAFIVANGVAL